ncbi:MAG: hypothetical protein JW809_19755 [Pirellulales bacterium]|nr:hypothetical protein [Pirellulales bacterium]
MKVAILSESPADEAALRVLAGGLLGQETEPVALPPLRTRGWMSVLQTTPHVLKYLHYQSDADAFVVGLDSDETVLHSEGHEKLGGLDPNCRLCQLQTSIDQTQRQLRSRKGRGPIKTAVALAVPAIEAWGLVAKDHRVNETAWLLGCQSGRLPYTKNELKKQLYGTDRPSLDLQQQCLVRAAQEIVTNGWLGRLEQQFRGGFGALARRIQGW